MSTVLKVGGTLMLQCEWFARCTNSTLQVAPHPILDLVPCCDRCRRAAEIPADRMRNVEIQQ